MSKFCENRKWEFINFEEIGLYAICIFGLGVYAICIFGFIIVDLQVSYGSFWPRVDGVMTKMLTNNNIWSTDKTVRWQMFHCENREIEVGSLKKIHGLNLDWGVDRVELLLL